MLEDDHLKKDLKVTKIGSNQSQNGKNKDKFYDYCKKKGHIIDYCYKLKNKKNNEDNNHNKPSQYAEAVVENNPNVDPLLITNTENRYDFE